MGASTPPGARSNGGVAQAAPPVKPPAPLIFALTVTDPSSLLVFIGARKAATAARLGYPALGTVDQIHDPDRGGGTVSPNEGEHGAVRVEPRQVFVDPGKGHLIDRAPTNRRGKEVSGITFPFGREDDVGLLADLQLMGEG